MRTLFAVDLEEGDARVGVRLAEAAPSLGRLGATVDLIYVDPFFPAMTAADQPAEVATLVEASLRRRESAQESRLQSLLATLPEEMRGSHFLIRNRKPSDEIASRAAGYDLLVIGTHGRRGISRAWLGSVAEKVVRASPIPALVLHAAPPSGRVLAAVDLGDRPDALLADAATWATRLGIQVDAIHVLPPPIAPDPGMIGYSAGWVDGLVESDRETRVSVERLVASLAPAVRGITMLDRGDPASAIAAAAADHALVVVRTHGRTGFGRFWLGSVSERVIRQSPVPVLVLPPAHD